MKAALTIIVVLVVALVGGYAIGIVIPNESAANLLAFVWGMVCGFSGSAYYASTS